MAIAYLDMTVGISGDMMLGALVDAGLDLAQLRQQLEGLAITHWDITADKVSQGGIQATKVTVTAHEPGSHSHRTYIELRDMIGEADLPEEVIQRSLAVLKKIAQAEAVVHGKPLEKVHFHELAGVDTLIDIVGSVVGLKLLDVEKLYCSALPVSHGYVDTAHGQLPVPPPAVTELLKGQPTVPVDIDGETVTPTGAALAVTLCDEIGQFPAMVLERIGYGAGTKHFPNRPNVLRLWVGQPRTAGSGGEEGFWLTDEVMTVEANIDDINPELYPYIVEQAFSAGALDVWLTPIQMKKGRPAVHLSALAAPENAEAIAEVILRESTTFGVRLTMSQRHCLAREIVKVETQYGQISVKVGYLRGEVVTIAPEYEDCRQAARDYQIPLKRVHSAAAAAAEKLWHQAGSH